MNVMDNKIGLVGLRFVFTSASCVSFVLYYYGDEEGNDDSHILTNLPHGTGTS
jgi:hypothetical protein